MLKQPGLILMLLVLAGFLPAWGAPGQALPAAAAVRDAGASPWPLVAHLELDLEQAVARVQPVLNRYGYLVVFVTILVEGVGIPAPGQTFLIAAALSAAHGNLSLVWVLISACLAAGLGNSLGYLLGRWGGRRLLARFKVRGDRLARLEEKFRRYGGGLLLVARFFDGLRQLNGIVAGMLEMPWKIFMAFNVLGAILWTGVWGLGTYFLDKEISPVHRTFAQIEPFVVALTLMGVLALMVYLFRRRRTKSTK
ncbi:MAG: DedA family protein [Deltaproteobacteria bacterium]|nr:DedA family protein [Deltaproteobacteria bacterium]